MSSQVEFNAVPLMFGLVAAFRLVRAVNNGEDRPLGDSGGKIMDDRVIIPQDFLGSTMIVLLSKGKITSVVDAGGNRIDDILSQQELGWIEEYIAQNPPVDEVDFNPDLEKEIGG